MISHLRSMLGRLQSLRQKITHLNPWVVFFGMLVLAVLVFAVLPAQAQNESGGVGDWMVRQVGKIMLVIANIAIGLTIFFLRFFIMIASYNNYIDVDVVQLGWIMVRDVANMFFVVALLVIAFGTILGLEEYEWKKNLAKLILAAILINFSNLICQLFIDVAHVFTITFLNAISATAGGNLISMFKLTEITRLAATQDPSGIDLELLAAAIPAMMFAIMAAAAVGSYVYVMTLRVVALWALIILSPLAFIFGVLPKTKSYAEKWWSEFTNHIIVAPIMVFFLWLAFATLGLGNIANQIQNGLPAGVQIDSNTQGQNEWKPTLSLSKVTTWENMANFLIAFAFLMRGIEEAQQTGATGAGAIGGAVDFAKKVGTIASGYAAGRWLAGKSKDMAVGGAMGALKGAGKLAYMGLLEDRVERIKNTVQRNTVEAWRNWRNSGPEIERVDEKMGEGQDLTEEEKAKGYAIQERKVKGDDGVEKTERYKTYAGYKYDLERDGEGKIKYENGEAVKHVVFRNGRQKFFYNRHMKLLQSRKQLEKVQKDTQLNEDMLDKSIEAQPVHLLSKKGERDMDRIKMGMLEAMEERSSAKTGEFKSMGREIVMGSKRYKIENDPKTGKLRGEFQNDRPTIAGQIAGHKEKQAERDKRIDQILATEKTKYQKGKGKNVLEGRVKAELEIKAQEAESHRLEAGATTRVALADVSNTDAFNTAMAAYQARLAGKGDSQSEEYKREAAQIVSEMTEEGLISEGEADQFRKNAELNKQIDAMEARGLSRQAAIDELVATEQMTEDQKKKADANGYFAEVYTGPRANILARTVESEKAGHLNTTRLERAQKAEEEKFTKGAHGQEELREETVLKEQIAASEEVVKREAADVKAQVAEGVLGLEDETEAFRKAQAARIAAQKQTEVREGRASVKEKDTTLAYETSDVGKEERKDDVVAKETVAATEAELKKAEAARKAEVAEDSGEFKAQMAKRIAAEKQAHTEEQKVATVEKEATEKYVLGPTGQHELAEEAALKARQAASDATMKEEETKADRVYRDDFLKKYKPRLGAIQRDLNSKDKATRAKAEEKMSALWDEIEHDENPVARKIAAEKRTKTESSRVEQLEKSMDQIYSGSSEGAKEMELDAQIAARKALSEADIKRRETTAQRKFKKSELGRRVGSQTKGFELQTQAEEAESKQRDAEAARVAGDNLRELFSRINFSEQATKAAEDFVKNIKEKDLVTKFDAATKKMSEWLHLGEEELAQKINQVTTATHTSGIDSYVAAVGQSQILKNTQDSTGIRQRQATDAAADAFINKLRLGTTTASTAYSDYTDTKLKDYKKLERAAAMKKATDVLAHLMEAKEHGDLDLDQTAELYAASSYLQSEAWNDDQAAYIYTMLEKLQSHQVDLKNGGTGKMAKEEAAKWTVMAKHFKRLGWVESDVMNDEGEFNIEADGTDEKTGKDKFKGKHIAKMYTRAKAADMQNLAITGGDVNLVVAHHRISSELNENAKEVKAAQEKARQQIINETLSDPIHQTKITEAEESARLQKTEELADSDLAEPEKQKLIDTAAVNARAEAAAEVAAKQIEVAMKKVNDSLGKSYWKIADEILKAGNDTGIVGAEGMKKKYAQHGDLLQDATKAYKGFAHGNGHEKLGGNQGFDEVEDSYRFMTTGEAQGEIRADRVKMKTRQLINSDQYHSNGGKLDLDTGILDDWLEDILNLSIGKISKFLDMADIPERSLKGAFYLHKNEKAKVAIGRDKLRGVKLAVLGGAKAGEKFIHDGDDTAEKQVQHMMTRGVVPALLSGHKGWAIAASKLYQHTKESDAQTGVINLKVGKEEFARTRDAAKYTLDQMDAPGGENYFKGTDLAGQEERIRQAMQQIIDDLVVRKDDKPKGGGNGGGPSGGGDDKPPGSGGGGDNKPSRDRSSKKSGPRPVPPPTPPDEPPAVNDEDDDAEAIAA